MNRTLVIGDIHGGLLGLKQVLERCTLRDSDHLIFLGDYVDGWSQSAEVIQFLIELQKTYKCDFIAGNHDLWCLEWLSGKGKNEIWLMHGGKGTVESYSSISDQEKEQHVSFFESMKDYIVDDQKRLFIHAGFSSMHGPHKEHYSTNYSWDRTLWEMAMACHGRINDADPHYPKRLKLFSEIYIGHTPTTEWDINHPWNRANVWNIDTGAAFKGKVSVLDIQTKEFWQSDTLQSLYPNEKGRN